MNFPSLPTDNIYKFIALSGAALLLFSVYQCQQLDIELQNIYLEEFIKIKDLELKVSSLGAEATELGQELKILWKAKEGDSTINPDLQTQHVASNELKIKRDKLYETLKYGDEEFHASVEWISAVDKQLELISKQKEIKNLSHAIMLGGEKVKLINERIGKVSKKYWFWQFVGLIVSFFGFRKWFERKQIFEDRILKGESEKYYKEFNSPHKDEKSGKPITQQGPA